MTEIGHKSRKDIKKVFVGRSITSVDENERTITLDDGTIITIKPNSGCWGCVSGNFYLDSLHEIENVITGIKLNDELSGEKTIYTLFVYTNAVKGKQELFTISGHAGNGWYGSGFTIDVEA